MKASMAMRHGIIPPNLLFGKLSLDVAPFYGNVQIQTSPVPCPSLPPQTARSASVNSFGFGAHAILEHPPHLSTRPSGGPTFLPFTLSAGSESSLRSSVRKYAEYLEQQKTVSLRDLAYTLNFTHIMFPYRASFASTSTEGLMQEMHRLLGRRPASTATLPTSRNIHGVFTGQGAQWPKMARELVFHSAFVQSIVDRLERTLSSLPEDDRPNWLPKEELLADANYSRVQQTALSPLLCTVVQIILVDILYAAEIHFAAVVGHCSNEIGAAYATGYISAGHVLLIAFSNCVLAVPAYLLAILGFPGQF